MSQSKLLSKQVNKAKQDIKTRYIAGESVPSISKFYDVSDRDIYYHLEPLSPDDKALHAKNAALRRMAQKKHEKDNPQVNSSASEAKIVKENDERRIYGEQSNQSPAQTPSSSLSDFVE